VTLLTIVALAGCQSTSNTPPPDSGTQTSAPKRPVSTGSRAHLTSIAALGAEGRWAEMSAALDEIRPNSLDARDVDYYRLLSADVALHEGRIDDANEIVASLSARAPETLGAEYGPLIARLCTARGDHVCAANAWLTTSVGNADRQTVNDRAWEAMGRTSRTEATRLAQSGDTRAAWQLREAIGTAFSLDEQRQRFRNWSSNWPGHAFTALPPTPLARALSTTWRPTTIAVFAPLSGNLAAAGHAVRDGMMAALLADSSQEKPRLVFYDSAAEPIALLYDRAAGAGASVIVGPVECGGPAWARPPLRRAFRAAPAPPPRGRRR
jgi:outer membrane PBP1 activator LpoA protein